MKFTDKKYLHILDNDNNKIYQLHFDVYQIGFPDDDIALNININSDNSMDLDFDADTTNMFNDPYLMLSNTKRTKLLIEIKKQLLIAKYPTDYHELIYK